MGLKSMISKWKRKVLGRPRTCVMLGYLSVETKKDVYFFNDIQRRRKMSIASFQWHSLYLKRCIKKEKLMAFFVIKM